MTTMIFLNNVNIIVMFKNQVVKNAPIAWNALKVIKMINYRIIY